MVHNGFRKNKSMKKQPESEECLFEHRTNGTDVFEALYIGSKKFPQHDLYPIATFFFFGGDSDIIDKKLVIFK